MSLHSESAGPRGWISHAIVAAGVLFSVLAAVYIVATTEAGQRLRWPTMGMVALGLCGGLGATGILYAIARRLAAAQAAAARSADAMRFLAEASDILASSLAYETTLVNVAQLVVPKLADWCTVDIVGEDEAIRRLASAHVDPAKVEWARELEKKYPIDRQEPRGIPNVIRTGKPELYPEISDAMLMEAAKDEEHLRILREVGLRSVMIVPLSARGRTLGTITFISAESGHRYSPEDLGLAEELAWRAALAMDNARLYREAQQANQTKDEFLAMVSHELRTPLNAILGWAQLLAGGTLDAKTAAQAVEAIERNSKAQAKLIDDLLDLSRVMRGKLQIEVAVVPLGQVIEAAIASVQPEAVRKLEIRRRVKMPAAAVMGDATRLGQVVWNLLANAVKFTPEGGSIEVGLWQQEGQAVIQVRDTGKGIGPDFLPHVFDRFRQAEDGSTTRQCRGLGLGLAIVRHLVELHKGTVTAESEGVGKGSTFTVRLPLAPAGAVVAAAPDEKPPRALGLDGPGSLAGVRVLVVDDEPDARGLLTTLLKKCGAEVAAAASAGEALAKMDEFHPNLLLSDIGMPGEDGYELMRKVRARGVERGGRIPAAALTAFARGEDKRRALAAGFQMHLAKPVEPADLLAAVRELSNEQN